MSTLEQTLTTLRDRYALGSIGLSVQGDTWTASAERNHHLVVTFADSLDEALTKLEEDVARVGLLGV